jgi:Uma2 family endonuclease
MPETKVKFTYEDYLQLPQDKHYELIEGEFIMVPSPGWSHQTVLKKLFRILDDYITSYGLGEIRFAPLDVVLSEDNVVQPDILFISKKRSHIIRERNIQGAPDLVIEVLSSATAKKDQGLKQKLYAKYGVKEYWIVDPQTKSIRVMALDERGLTTFQIYKTGRFFGSSLLKNLSFDLEEIF